MTKNKLICFSLVCGFISTLLFTMIGFSNSCSEIYDNVVRIRIIANSNSKEDQDLKISIRDAVLQKSTQMFDGITSYDDAIKITSENSNELINIARETVSSYGYDYNVSMEVRDEFFDTRVYDDFTLPAGTYKTAVFTLGEGMGENWWCVIFPKVCVGACGGSLTDAVSNTSADYAYNSDEYVIKFKTVEIFEKIKKYLNL